MLNVPEMGRMLAIGKSRLSRVCAPVNKPRRSGPKLLCAPTCSSASAGWEDELESHFCAPSLRPIWPCKADSRLGNREPTWISQLGVIRTCYRPFRSNDRGNVHPHWPSVNDDDASMIDSAHRAGSVYDLPVDTGIVLTELAHFISGLNARI